MERLFEQRLPDVDLTRALESNRSSSNERVLESILQIEPTPTTEVSSGENGGTNNEDLLEALPEEAHGFDWKEEADLDNLADGMAALSVEPEGVGYLGMSFLRPMPGY